MRLRGTSLVLALLALFAHEAIASPQADPPRTLLWVWDRPQLFSAPPEGMGIAYLHATVRLSGTQSRTTWRQWPLRIAPGITVIPVVHVTLDNLAPSPVDDTQQQAIARALEHAAAHSRSGWVQLDFEARRSQREAYVALLQRLQPLRANVRLSATALASWCMSDPWLPAGLVDEVVPMYFRMDAESARIRQRLQATGAATVPACRDAAGLLLGEPWPALGGVKRRYVFHTGAWKTEDFEKIDNRDAHP
ncbi:hypothetical protein GNX71_31775 [Variovorax sp. RKNM96]|uniref:hypothetical protein n=1 Tax=Variovorax sp. RKNM96 TaxID=2681552 RepID=UPI00197EA022|nr:hypothetical protein [Variovorax sp. RKNM96]QSI33902.1 hypothetical protein GNX71_31775 [Variovorax sp. RKNM96]